MMNIKIEVNGITVTIIEASNIGMSGSVHEYFYRGTTFPIDRDQPPKVFHGTIRHSRVSGINLLAERILRDIAEKT